MTLPAAGETKVLYSTISFNIQNLIQFYAGQDNIPYTSDDVIIYAPDYWERATIQVAFE